MLNKLQAKLRSRKGFTLIELIVVIAIIVILIALIAPNATKLIGTARQTRADGNAKTIYTAAQAYLTDQFANGKEAPSTLTVDTIKDYLTSDYKNAGTVTITSSGYVVSSVSVVDGTVTGTYPKAASSSAAG